MRREAMRPEPAMWGYDLVVGRHRRPEPPAVVHLVFGEHAAGGAVVLAADSAFARSISGVAQLISGGERTSGTAQTGR